MLDVVFVGSPFVATRRTIAVHVAEPIRCHVHIALSFIHRFVLSGLVGGNGFRPRPRRAPGGGRFKYVRASIRLAADRMCLRAVPVESLPSSI
jgi:hypothetical protein